MSGSGPQPPNRSSTSKFNERKLALTVTLPSNYAATYGSFPIGSPLMFDPQVGAFTESQSVFVSMLGHLEQAPLTLQPALTQRPLCGWPFVVLQIVDEP